jgi:hypothetical protein
LGKFSRGIESMCPVADDPKENLKPALLKVLFIYNQWVMFITIEQPTGAKRAEALKRLFWNHKTEIGNSCRFYIG